MIRNKYLAVFALMLVTSISCKDEFLEVPPTSSLTESLLATRNGLEAQLISSYSMLSGRGGFYAGSTNWLWGSILGGEANKGTNSGDQSQANEIQAYDAQSTNGSVREKYSTTYEGIARVNALLRTLKVTGPEVADDVKTRIEAEAKFLRGHYYFELKKIYNNTPYINEDVDYAKGITEIGNDVDLLPKIISDFQFAYDNLPGTMDAAGRANKWAAGAYLGKALLYQANYATSGKETIYAQAKVVFDKVIADGTTASGVKYGLLDKYGDLWRISNDNSKETVFAIQSAAGTGTINNANPDFALNYPYNGGPAGCCGFNQPSFELVNSYRTAGGLPLLDGSYNDPANAVKSDQRVSSATAFTPDAGPLDPRLDHNVGRRGIPYLDHGDHPGKNWIRDQDYGGPYAPKKFIWSKEEEASGGVDKSSWTPGYTALNVPIIRFADVLLMDAEVEIELGNLEDARANVNLVRARAANSAGFVTKGGNPAANYVISQYNTTWTDPVVAQSAVRMERKLELAGEGHRFFDLVRWGIAEEELNNYLALERAMVGSASPFIDAEFTAGKSEFLPIPQDEIDLLGKDLLKQNPGYN